MSQERKDQKDASSSHKLNDALCQTKIISAKDDPALREKLIEIMVHTGGDLSLKEFDRLASIFAKMLNIKYDPSEIKSMDERYVKDAQIFSIVTSILVQADPNQLSLMDHQAISLSLILTGCCLNRGREFKYWLINAFENYADFVDSSEKTLDGNYKCIEGLGNLWRNWNLAQEQDIKKNSSDQFFDQKNRSTDFNPETKAAMEKYVGFEKFDCQCNASGIAEACKSLRDLMKAAAIKPKHSG